MPNLSRTAPCFPVAAIVLVCAALAGCGGGGGSAPATGPASAAPTGGDTSNSSAGGSVNGGSSASSGDPVTSPPVTIADAVGTMRALSVSALISMGLPVTPDRAPALAVTATHTYHVDSVNGSDAGDGLVAVSAGGSAPWRTLARVAAAGLVAGDRIELACGSVWHETLRVATDGGAGSPIVVTQPAAGCTTPPAIDGSVAIAATAWTLHQGHIWKAPLAAAPMQLFANSGTFTAAHYPNSSVVAVDPGSPWLALAADSAGSVLTTGADLALPAGATLDATARVHVRTNTWLIEDMPVTAFDGMHITLGNAPTYTVKAGWGYYLTGQLWMLGGAGQWWYDAAAGQVYAWMPDSAAPAAVGASTLATGIDLQGRSHVVVDGVVVRGVGMGVDARSTTDVTLRNLTIEDTADLGIDVAGSDHDVVENSIVARTGGDGVTGWGGAMTPTIADSNALVARNNVIRDSGVRLDGDTVTSLPRRSQAALFIGMNSTASGNVIVNAGYVGILTQLNATVTGNFIYGACSVQDDCGGIYTGRVNNHSQITNNTVVHSRGMLFGQPVGARSTAAQGIYIDDLGSDVVIESNTVIDNDYGIQLHNTARNTVQSNRLFGNRRGQIWMQEDSNALVANGDMAGNVVSGNQIAPISGDAVGLLLTSTYASTSDFGTFAGNRFYDRISPAVVANSAAPASSLMGFGAWSGSTGFGSTQAVDTQGMAVSAAGYAAWSRAGANIVPNGALQNDSAGWSGWNDSAPAGQMNRTSCPAGMCLQYVAGGSSGILSSPGFALQQGAWYRLTVDTSTQTDGQVVPLVVRRGSGDYATLSDRTLSFVGNRAWSRNSVVFQATQTVAGAGARVDFDRVVAGQSLTVTHLEIVQVTPDTSAQNSSVVVNAAATPLSATCPFAHAQPAACAQTFDLATAQPVTWPLTVPARSAVIVYVQNPALVDSDHDGIPDSEDTCASTSESSAVDASGCPLSLH